VALPHERDARAHTFLALTPFQFGAEYVKECPLRMQQGDMVLRLAAKYTIAIHHRHTDLAVHAHRSEDAVPEIDDDRGLIQPIDQLADDWRSLRGSRREGSQARGFRAKVWNQRLCAQARRRQSESEQEHREREDDATKRHA